MWMISSVYRKITDIVFPPLCYLCKEKEIAICEKCLDSLRRPIDIVAAYIHSTFSYKDLRVKNLLHSIKYYHKKDLLVPLAKVLADEMNNVPYTGILVPIPMSPLRKYMRGYNQAEELTKILSSLTGLPYNTKLLKRSIFTKRQVTTKNKRERLDNPKKTFYLSSDKSLLEKLLHNNNIILVDDITTTGATLDEARKILLHAGAKNVQAVTLAH